MSSSRYELGDRHRRSRSRSHRHREDYDYDDDFNRRSSSRSRSRSVDRYRRRRKRDSRSRSRDYKRRHHKYTRRHRDSRSKTRSRSHSPTSSQRSRKHHTRTRSRSNSRSSHRSYKLAHSYQSTSRSPKGTTAKHQESRRSSSINTVSKRHLSEDPTVRRIETDEGESHKFVDQENNSTQYFSSNTETDLENLPLPEQTETSKSNYDYYLEPEEPIDKERIHREMEEKLREALAKEGKIYPPPKPEASHPVFANDGSFLEIFKKMQEAQTMTAASTSSLSSSSANFIAMPTVASTFVATPNYVSKLTTPAPPMVGRRRGGKILKTGLVAKPKAVSGSRDDKDFWSLYLSEVNKYKNNACELDLGNRPLLK